MQHETEPIPLTQTAEDASVPREAVLLFAPLDKRAFGIAIGTVVGTVIFVLTVSSLLITPRPSPNIALLKNYFPGYSLSAAGSVIGLAWGFGVGFLAGWFVALMRNFTVAALLFLMRTRAELAEARDFLDHI